MRALIYARFSSNLQNDRSIEDQVRVCRDRAIAEGWTVEAVHPDYAISGAVRDRPGLNALLADVAAGRGEIVLTESWDRLSRDQEDGPYIFKRVRHVGARIVTLSEGDISELHVGLKGTMAALFRIDLADKVRRGQRGRALAGKNAGGLAYGYRLVRLIDARNELVRGEREVDPDQADIVRRTFAEFLAGMSPRAIAERLNAEGVAGPRGGTWRASTINGDRVRKNGILQNEIYAGRIVYNKTHRVYDPETRKRRVRPNDPAQWVVVETPELRIVDDATWSAVSERRARFDGTRAHQHRRPKRLLSGLAFCGVCGGRYTVKDHQRWGCGNRGNGRGCTNGATIFTNRLEERVLDGLEEHLLDPDLFETYAEEWRRARVERLAATGRTRRKLERQLDAAEGKLKRLIVAIGDDRLRGIEEVAAAASAAAIERDRLQAQLQELEAEKVVALHPGLAADYRQRVTTIRLALAGDDDAAKLAAVPAIRSLIDRVTITPAASGRGTEIELTGRLAAILEMAGGARNERVLKLVPLEGHGLNHTFLRIAV